MKAWNDTYSMPSFKKVFSQTPIFCLDPFRGGTVTLLFALDRAAVSYFGLPKSKNFIMKTPMVSSMSNNYH